MTREEEWLKRNGLRHNDSGVSIEKEMPVSIIKWQTGEPKENGFYAVTYQFPNNCRANVTALAYTGKTWINGDWQEIDKSRIIARCTGREPNK